MISLFVDPGKKQSACARFDGSRLVDVGFWPSVEYRDARILVVEKPEIYPGSTEKNPNDLIAVAMAAQNIADQVPCAPKFVLPRTWKGQVKKPIHHARLWSVLEPEERTVLAKRIGMTSIDIGEKIRLAQVRLATTGKVTGYSWAAHNLLDAIGIGVWHFGRIGTGGVRR